MIYKISKNYKLTAIQDQYLSGFPGVQSLQAWNSQTNVIKEIKESIRSQLSQIQNNKCCYCGLSLEETSRIEIDHIAPKSSRKKSYPEFAFKESNLALSCELCNGSSRKGEADTILSYSSAYNYCKFKLVHPYFDDPQKHYKWINSKLRVVISHTSWKGKYSIILFGLNKEARISARAKQRNFEKEIQRQKIKQNVINKAKRIINFFK
jgi:uncharacterized protein (TIGR02646 family)